MKRKRKREEVIDPMLKLVRRVEVGNISPFDPI